MPSNTPPDEATLLSAAMLEAVQIDDIAFDEELIRTPGDIAYWNARYTQALRVYLLADHHAETVRARLHLELKAGSDSTGEVEVEDGEAQTGKRKRRVRGPTVDDIKAMVLVHPEYQTARLAAIEAEAEKEQLRKFTEALVARKDMLQSIGAKLRLEMANDPVVREQVARTRRRT